VTGTVPLAAKSALEIATLISDDPTIVACFAVPFQLSVELETKLEPVTVSVNPFAPAAALDGEIA